MAGYQLEQMSFSYPQAATPTLRDISLTVSHGDFVLLGGPTGSGKSTLLRLLKKQTQPAGRLTGEIRYDSVLLCDLPDRQSAEDMGMVFQNPDNQIVMNTVRQELCQGMENLGYPPLRMQKRMAEVVPYFGMEDWLHQSVETLSGGQKQMLNLASAMMLQPKVLLLDEPTAQLDPIAAGEFIDLLVRINQELSVTVILCEHRLDNLYPHANQVWLLQAGAVVGQGTPGEVIRHLWKGCEEDFIRYLPAVSRLFLRLGQSEGLEETIPITVKEGKRWFNRLYQQNPLSFGKQTENIPDKAQVQKAPLLQCEAVAFRYEAKGAAVLHRLSFEVHEQEFFVVLGGNGAGKSTLLQLIAGALPHQRGQIIFQQTRRRLFKPVPGDRNIGYVGQDPMAYFTRETVAELLQERADSLGLGDGIRLSEIVQWFQLEAVLSRHPFDLSGGQQQLVVLALVLLADPALFLMDEPTKGLDPIAKNRLAQWLHRLREQGRTIVMVSHDIEFAAAHATRCGLLFDGAMLAVDEPRAFFSENYYYTTAVHRTVRDCLSLEVTEEGVLSRWKRP